MEPYAVIETGGKQYRVKAGDTFRVERLRVETGSEIDLSPVLAFSDGEKLEVGAPEVEGVAVKAAVLDHIRGEKVISFKKKRRKGYSRKIGHRQELTVLRIADIKPSAGKKAKD
jgi:large subunit ribosomal protein L21